MTTSAAIHVERAPARRVYRAWRAPLVAEPYGLARPRDAGPCEPPAWVRVDVGLDVRDHVAADEGASMWRIVDDNAYEHHYAWMCGEPVEITSRAGGDALRGWDTYYDAGAMVRSVMGLLDLPLVQLASLACARDAVARAGLASKAPGIAIEMAENVLRAESEGWTPNEGTMDRLGQNIADCGRYRGNAGLAAHHAARSVFLATTNPYWAKRGAVSGAEFATSALAAEGNLADVVRGVIPTRALYDAIVSGRVPER